MANISGWRPWSEENPHAEDWDGLDLESKGELTTNEAANWLRLHGVVVTRRALTRRCREGRFANAHKNVGYWRIPTEDLLEFLAEKN